MPELRQAARGAAWLGSGSRLVLRTRGERQAQGARDSSGADGLGCGHRLSLDKDARALPGFTLTGDDRYIGNPPT